MARKSTLVPMPAWQDADHDQSINGIFARFVKQGLIVFIDGRWQLTAEGRKALAASETDGH